MLEVCVTGIGSVNKFGAAETDLLKSMFPKTNLRRMPLGVQMALMAAKQALAEIPYQTGLVVGSAFTSVQMSFDFMDSILNNGPRLSSPTAFSHAVNNMLVGLLSINLNIQGPCHTVSQFGLSFAGALNLAGILLHAKRAEYILLGAVEEQDPRFELIANKFDIQNSMSGAVFFALSLQGDGPMLSLPLWEQNQDLAAPVFNMEGEYASIAQARRLAELSTYLQENGINQAWCIAKQDQKQAAIRIRRA